MVYQWNKAGGKVTLAYNDNYDNKIMESKQRDLFPAIDYISIWLVPADILIDKNKGRKIFRQTDRYHIIRQIEFINRYNWIDWKIYKWSE